MDHMDYIVDLHKEGARQGPGGTEQTLQALELTGLAARAHLRAADLGCGTGASTLVLAEHLDASVCAVDLFPEFLDILRQRAESAGLSSKIQTLARPMEELEFPGESLDLLWSEGAVYNIGFSKGISSWRRFLKPGGFLAVSEITWTTLERPAEIDAHWKHEYPEIGTVSEKVAAIEEAGYSPAGFFLLPESCWLENFYHPLEQRCNAFLERHNHHPAAREIIENEKREIELYRNFKAYVTYGFYIAKRIG